MTGENNNENKLKQCLNVIINAVSDAIKTSDKDFDVKIKKLLDDNVSSLSSQYRNFLLNILYEYNYNDQDKTFIIDDLDRFLYNLKGRLSLLDASQGAWDGDQSIVENFIENYPTLKDKSGLYGTTLLYSAARNNHFSLVKYLVNKGGCSVNAKNEEYLEKGQHSTPKATIGSTPLHAACFHGHLHIVKYMIGNGADYFILNSLHESPIDNGQSQGKIRKFFTNFILLDYSTNKTILQEIEQNKEQITDCIWEYKPLSTDQWFPFATDPSTLLQQSLSNKQFQTDIQLKTTRDGYQISMVKFLRSGRHTDQIDNFAWVRCRGSSLRNFHCYSQWQIMFIKHPTGVKNSSSPLQIFDMTSASQIELSSWYNFNRKMNFLFETAMNYRRKYVNINLDFINNEKLIFDLVNFTFTNEQNTIEGFLRWIPKIVSNDTNFTVLDNFQLSTNTDFVLLTRARLKQAETGGNISPDEINQYSLKYEDAFKNDNLYLPYKEPTCDKDLTKLVHVVQDDLLASDSDVIVICTSSKYLFESVCKIGGNSLKKSFDHKFQENQKAPVISITTDGKLPSKAVYFVRWEPNSDPNILWKSIGKLVSNVIKTAASENYKSIAFPAIGCGEYGCSINVIAQAFVRAVKQQLITYPITISFVIQPNKTNIYDEFQQQVDSFQQQEQNSITIDKGIIQIEKGDITKQTVDVIIGSSSSENLRQILIKAGGSEVETAYTREYTNNPNSLIISTPPGPLNCKRLFFLKWEPNKDPEILRQSIIDLIWNLIQNVSSHNFTSIAFPAIGCGEHACSVDVVVKTMVREMKQQITNRKLPWTVKFIVQPNQQNVYDEFCKQLLSSDDSITRSSDYELPSTWQKSKENKLQFIVPKTTDEYKSIFTNFDAGMKGKYKEIIRIERIQNERWYMQYLAHSRDFKQRLGEDTEKRLYHGCPDVAANSIIEDCFNRSFAGVNGTAYGIGVYFSSDVVYSHGYTRPNSKRERCMFVARVLVGKTTLGNSSMKTRPVGFDSTTDGNHMFITYHDAQAYAEYLITYK